MTKQTRREFLFNIGVTAITATTGFAMSAVRVEETELTKVEQQYAEMLSREQDLPYDIQAGIDAMESYVAGFDLEAIAALDWLTCDIDIRIGYGHCQDDRIIGTVESVSDDGSVNVRLNDAVSIDFDGWMYSDGTS